MNNRYIQIFFVFVILFALRTPCMPVEFFFYGTHALNMIEPNYLCNSPEVLGINQTISPRIIYDYLLFIPMKAGMSFEITAFLWNIIADLVFSIGTVSLVSSVRIKKQLPLTVLFVLCLISPPIISSSFGFPFYNEQVPPITLGISIEIIAISNALRNRWGRSFFYASIGALFHIHEGIYGGSIICILFIISCIHRKKIRKPQIYWILLWAVSIILLILPSLLTDRTKIDNVAFTDFYKQYVGHTSFFNALPSNIFYILSSISLFYISYNKLRRKSFLHIEDFGILLGIVIIGFFVVILFIDVFPWALICKLYIQKFFKYIALLMILFFMEYMDDLLDEKNSSLLQSQRILLFISNTLTPVIVVISAISEFVFKNKKILVWFLLTITLTIDIYMIIKVEKCLEKLLVMIIILPLIIIKVKQRRYCIISSFVAAVFLLCNCVHNYVSNWDNVFYSKNIDTSENEVFCQKMKELVPKGETYLPSPSIGKDIFKINIKTGLSSYVWPGPPSTSLGTKINLERMSTIKNWDNYTYDDKMLKAKELGIRYVLLKVIETPHKISCLARNNNYVLIKVD